jgi:hypothetical protein
MQLSFGSESQIRSSQCSFGSESQIRSSQCSFGSESQIRCRTYHSAANANSLKATQFWQRITNFAAEHTIWQRMLIRYRQLSFGSESQISLQNT